MIRRCVCNLLQSNLPWLVIEDSSLSDTVSEWVIVGCTRQGSKLDPVCVSTMTGLLLTDEEDLVMSTTSWSVTSESSIKQN